MLAVVIVVLLAPAVAAAPTAQEGPSPCWNLTKSFSYNYPDAVVQYPTIRVEGPRFGDITVNREERTNGQIDVRANVYHTPQQTQAQITEVTSETTAGPVLTIVVMANDESPPPESTPPQEKHAVAVRLSGVDLRSISVFLVVLVFASVSKGAKGVIHVHPLVLLLCGSLLLHTVLSECSKMTVAVSLPSNRNSAGEFCVTSSLSLQGEVQVLTITDSCVREEEDIVTGDCQVSGFSLPACQIPMEIEFTASPAAKYVMSDGCVVPSHRLESAEVTFTPIQGQSTTHRVPTLSETCKHGASAPANPSYKVPFAAGLGFEEYQVAMTVRNTKGTKKTFKCKDFNHVLPKDAIPPGDIQACWGHGCDFSSDADYTYILPTIPVEDEDVHGTPIIKHLPAPSKIEGAIKMPSSVCKTTFNIGVSSSPFCLTMDIQPLAPLETFLDPTRPSQDGVFPFVVPPRSELKPGHGYYLQVSATNGLGTVTRCFKNAFIVF